MSSKLRLLTQAGVSILPGFLKFPIYRLLFRARIGKGVKIGFGAILSFDRLSIEAGARIGAFNVIRVSELALGKRARIGSFVRVDCHTLQMGSASTISSRVSIMADHRDSRSRLVMGSESWILDYCYVNPARAITLGRNVGVGGGSYLFTHGLWLSKLDGYPVSFGPINIGNDVWLPWGCFIMSGVDIGSGTVIGAKSLVTKSIPAGALAAGSPAKIIRETVAVSPGIAEKNRMLLEATEEFVSYVNGTLEMEETGGWTACRVNGDLLMLLASAEETPEIPSGAGNDFCLVHTEYRQIAGTHRRSYSLKTYQCCPYDEIGTLQRRWLAHLRLIGVRYYPIDEVQIEG